MSPRLAFPLVSPRSSAELSAYTSILSENSITGAWKPKAARPAVAMETEFRIVVMRHLEVDDLLTSLGFRN